jgi:transposase-like protein
VIDRVRIGNVSPIISQHVAKGSTVYTDEHQAYNNLHYDYDHQRVNHKKGEYVRGSAGTNGIESVWALSSASTSAPITGFRPKHMDAYLNEITFRLNRRDLDKGQRHGALLSQIEGPLPYKALIA